MASESPADPTPRQLLIAAQTIAAGMPESIAACLGGMYPDRFREVRCDNPGVEELVTDCQAVQARPQAERDENLHRMLRQALERTLADGKVGAISAAMRLLGLAAQRVPAAASNKPEGAKSAPSPGRAPATGRKKKEETPEQPEIDEARVWELWRMCPDDEGDWQWTDGELAMPTRDVHVVAAAGGPIRLIDITPEEANPDLLAGFDAMTAEEAHAFNHLAYPTGGLQWDWRTRTLWIWEGPPARPRPKVVASGTRPAGAQAGPSPPRSPHVTLRAQLERLLVQPAPRTAEELDLAEAVCAQLWPNWPRYTGAIDGFVLRDVLAARPLDPTELKRLAGCLERAPRARPS
jgi:hypothetical protein